MQRAPETHSSKWTFFIKSLPSEFRELQRRGGKKRVRVKGNGGDHENQGPHELKEPETAEGPTQVFTRSSMYVLELSF
jgi:hypothetical protein